MKVSAVWWTTGLCVAFMIPSRAIAQTPSLDGGTDWGNSVNNIMIQNYMTDRQFERMRESYGIKEPNSPSSRSSPPQGTRTTDSAIAPRLLAAKFPKDRRVKMEQLYSALLKLYPVSAKLFGLPADNSFENITAVFICSNMQMVSQQQVSAANCMAVSQQMKRAAERSRTAQIRQVTFEKMAITSSMMNVMFAGMQQKPDPKLQAQLVAQASQNIQMLTKIPVNQLQITSEGLSRK